MNIFFYIFLNLIIGTFSVLPTWNIKTSAIDLLDGKDSHTYLIDHRNWWYDASDNFSKIIKRTNGKITHENVFTLQDLHWGTIRYNNTVKFEAIESFYKDTNSKTYTPIVCPRGKYNPLKVISTSEMSELTNADSNWKKNDKFDLKCYFHRSDGGHFLVYDLMNENNFLSELTTTELKKSEKYGFDIDEMYDFKLLNRPNFDGNDEGSTYSFIGLAKKIMSFV